MPSPQKKLNPALRMHMQTTHEIWKRGHLSKALEETKMATHVNLIV